MKTLSNRVRANNLDIYYETEGQGEPLLLIHGGTSNLSMWRQHIPRFAEHFQVIAPDSRGHGRTERGADAWSYRLMAEDMAALINVLGLQKPLVCGYSDGGQIALELAMNYPGLAKAYVVGGAAIEWQDKYFEALKSFGMVRPGEVDIEFLEKNQPELVQYLRDKHDMFQGQDYWKTYMADLSRLWLAPLHYSPADLARILDPILILLGDRDEGSDVEQAVKMYRLIPNSELALVPGADHYFFQKKIDIYMQLTLDFLSRQSETTKPNAADHSE